MGILRREAGAPAGESSDCGTAVANARGAATAPATTLPVVARKPLRVEERRGSNLSGMDFLDVECDQRNIIRMTKSLRGGEKFPGEKICKNKNRPEAGGFSS